ncbi:MAG: PQQ-dependent sugar dehydrogenase [Alphaproteobacteria bacterium]|nr:PQQ-dependent sugar dehydrogenase [Alphaproteobacteria bacterium]
MAARFALWGTALFFSLGSAALADVAPPPDRPAPPKAAEAPVVKTGYKVSEVAKGLDHPWSLAFLPDGSILVTERAGRLRLITGGKLQPQPIGGVPPVHTGSQAGLFDVVLHPKFAENQFIYLTYAHGSAGANATRVARARFDGGALKDLKVIFEAKPSKDTNNHYGAKLAFLGDGTFALTIGDGFEYREKAQDLSSHLGKIVRLNDDGSVPSGVTFANAAPGIFSLGHRNQQGLAYDSESGRLYETEHGPQGGDELNIIEPGMNYGWPVITYGMDYSGAYVSPYTQRPGMEQPVLVWTPSIAPSGLAVYRGDKFPGWNGDLFVGALAFKHLRRIDIDERGEVAGQSQLLTELGARIRDVRVSPDGFIYVTTDDAAGRVLMLEPGP